MFHAPVSPGTPLGSLPQGASASGRFALLDRIARASSRPRYAFALISLIAEAADGEGRAGPFVSRDGHAGLLRDWLCDGLAPLSGRAARRRALAEQVGADLAAAGLLPANPAEARAAIDEAVRERVRASAKTNLSRAVSELVRAGLLRRHYAGYRVDHVNRGAQRHAVYTLCGAARCLLPEQRRPAGYPAQFALDL